MKRFDGPEGPDDDAPDEPGAPSAEPAGGEDHEAQPAPRGEPIIPDDDPADHETGKRFMVGLQRLIDKHVQLRVTVNEGEIEEGYGPAELLAALATAVTDLLKDVGGNFPPMLFGVVPDGSMSLYFGDPVPDDSQERLALGITESNASRVSQVLQAEGPDEVFAQALRLGRGATSYRELARLVESRGVTLNWQVRNDRPVELKPDRAAAQVIRLSQEPPVREREITVNGRLYRVIDERRDEQLGTIGIHLFKWSPKPPLWSATLLPSYRTLEVRRAIKDGLIGENVEAVLTIRQPVPGQTLEPDKRPDLIVKSIEPGPGERDGLGDQLDTGTDDED